MQSDLNPNSFSIYIAACHVLAFHWPQYDLQSTNTIYGYKQLPNKEIWWEIVL